jgi:hypothetical protein
MSAARRDLNETFRQVVDALNTTQVLHAFIGALPVLAWGRVRATTDIDLVIVASGWERVVDALRRREMILTKHIGPAEHSDELPDVAVFHTMHKPSIRIDIFIAKTEFENAVIATAREATVLGLSVRLASPEASIIYKLLAQRRRDLDDVDSIFAARQAAGERLDWPFLEHWATEWGITERLAPYRDRPGPGSDSA